MALICKIWTLIISKNYILCLQDLKNLVTVKNLNTSNVLLLVKENVKVGHVRTFVLLKSENKLQVTYFWQV